MFYTKLTQSFGKFLLYTPKFALISLSVTKTVWLKSHNLKFKNSQNGHDGGAKVDRESRLKPSTKMHS